MELEKNRDIFILLEHSWTRIFQLVNVKVLSISHNHIIIQRVRNCKRVYCKRTRVTGFFYTADLIRRNQENKQWCKKCGKGHEKEKKKFKQTETMFAKLFQTVEPSVAAERGFKPAKET